MFDVYVTIAFHCVINIKRQEEGGGEEGGGRRK